MLRPHPQLVTTVDPLGSLLGRAAIGYVPRQCDLDALPIVAPARHQVETAINRTVCAIGALRSCARYSDARRLARAVASDLQVHLYDPDDGSDAAG